MIRWTDAPNGSAGHIGEALIVQIRLLAIGGWSAGWRNGMKWDVSDQTTQIAEQSSRHFRSLAAAKGAVRDHLLANGVIVAEERATPRVLGRWREVNVLLQEAAKVTWTAPGRTGIRTWIGCISGHPVATIKRQPGHVGSACTAWIDGWVWIVPEVGNPSRLIDSVARGFESVPAAKKAINGAIKAHPLKR
ncbi:hypothetical protein [Burkholderia contaminans]|uniref:hypothetical protein n=1 Tax=Burkholderia contaminans TaxID=488447 RepID=UPI0011B23A6F|nr:hypothetical protein [Burkholderia contaminans]